VNAGSIAHARDSNDGLSSLEKKKTTFLNSKEKIQSTRPLLKGKKENEREVTK
jgi:hypothetical protein